MLKFFNNFTHHLAKDSTLFSHHNINSLFDSIEKERKNGVSGYYELCEYDNSEIINYIQTNIKLIESLKNLVIIGIGGSSLGTKAIDSLLEHSSHRRKIAIRFLEHTDPIAIQKDLKRLKPEESLFIVISKSGSTIETTSLFKFILHKYSLLKDNLKSRLLVITDKNSPLEFWAMNNQIKYINIAPNIGGRFSVLSAVGLVPLGILGYDIFALLNGAKAVKNRFFERNHKSIEHIVKKALFLSANENTLPINVLFSYSSVFREFNAWFVQLWGESLGKIDKLNQRRGLTPIALIGSIDQHSFLQLIMQGPRNKSVSFLSVKNLSTKQLFIPDLSLNGLESTDYVNRTSFNKLLKMQALATKESIIAQNVPVDSIELDTLCEESVGSLIMYFELLTSCVGSLLKIDTYNQPGVEFGKQILYENFLHI